MTSQANNLVLKSVEDLFGRTLYSFKTHAKQADLYKKNHGCFKNTEIILIAISGCGILSTLIDFFPKGNIVAIIANAISLGISIHLSSSRHEDLIKQHLDTSQKLWLLKEQLLNLINDYKQNLITINELMDGRDIYTKTLNDLYSTAPQTSPKAYESARKALKDDEEHTFSRAEISNLSKQQPKP